MSRKVLKQIELFWREANFSIAALQPAGAEIDFEIVEKIGKKTPSVKDVKLKIIDVRQVIEKLIHQNRVRVEQEFATKILIKCVGYKQTDQVLVAPFHDY